MSHVRKQGESDADFVKRRVAETGQLWAPNNADGPNVKPADLAALKLEDPAIREGIRGLSRMMVQDYAVQHALKTGSTQPPFDGKADAAMMAVLETARCDVPDYPPPPGAQFAFEDSQVQEVCKVWQASPAVGGGNWPRCHNIGDFHCVYVKVDETNRPSWMTDAILLQVMKNVQDAYAAMGQWVVYVNAQGKDYLTGKDESAQHVDTKMSWVRSSSGWIGLAILTLGLGCSDEIWQQFLGTYTGGSSDAAKITQWTTLVKHEHGHNSGCQHTNGGVMNPSIVNGLPIEWTASDPSTPRLKSWYGGAPVVPPGGTPTPPNPPIPTPGTVEQRLKWLEDKQFEDNIRNTLQDVRDQLHEARLKKLEARP